MMNLVALAFIISYISAVVVFVPEPKVSPPDPRGDSSPPGGLFGPAKEAVQNVACDKEPCPTSMDQVKDILIKGYAKTGEGIDRAKEGTKETVQGAYEQSKRGVLENAEWAKEGIQEGAQVIQERAGQAKQGVYDTAHHAGDGVREKTEQVKQGVQEVPGKVASYVPSKEEAGSYIPGAETGKEAADKVREKVGEVKERVSLENLRYRLDELRRDAAQYLEGRERESSYPEFADMKRKLDEAWEYIPGRDMAASYIPGIESVENVKGGSDRAAGGGRGMFQALKERLGGRGGGGMLERRVQDLCMWFGDGGGRRGDAPLPIFLDVAATRQSYAYLMQSALGAIDGAQEVFDHATMENAGGEWREKYAYLADSSKGALQASKEVFDRAASAAEGTLRRPRAHPRPFAFPSEDKNVSKLAMAAARARYKLHATVRPLTRSLYLATFSAVYGLTLWMTFLSGHLLAQVLPRQQLGIVQSKLFPVYLRIITGSIALCGFIHALLHPWPVADRPEHWQYLNLGLCIAAGLLNMLAVEPRATKMMAEKLKIEKEEGRGQIVQETTDDEGGRATIDNKLKGFHQLASLLNLAIVAGLTWHLWYLANRLVV